MPKQKLNITILGVTAFALLTASPAFAHTSYLKPNTFSTTRRTQITLESAFTENFSNPQVVVKSQDWRFYTPDGLRKTYDNIVSLKQMTVLEQKLDQDGTYRFSTGERLGRKGKMIKLEDGSLKSMFNKEGKEVTPPAGATIITSQTATVADVYVTKGAPTNQVLQTRIGRLVIAPITHPSEIYMDDGFELKLTFDGKPLINQTMTLYRDGGLYAEDKGEISLNTGSDSITKINFKHPGIYLLMTRHRADAPAGSDTDIRSYTTSLTFEVTP